ncbi:MAG: ABC transporter permease, partial [Vallitaleaceae bacterium]|nr:ABC transporter permease [Vallitaleaceae bacterium]
MFFRLSIRNLGKRKFRSFLIVLSVALSVALLYTIMSLSLTITDFYGDMISKTTGETDILVSPKEASLLEGAEENYFQQDQVEFVIPMLDAFAYRMNEKVAEPIFFHGVEFNDMKVLYPNDFKSTLTDEEEKDFSGQKVILGEYTSKYFNLGVGDSLRVTMDGKELDFIVYKVEQDSNLLSSSSTMQNVMIPMDTLKEILGTDERVSALYIGVVGENQKEQEDMARTLVSEWEAERTDLDFQLTRDSSALGEMLQIIQISLSLMTMSVLLVSAFIIFSTFKVIILERMSFIGTIRSLGATKKVARKVLFTEGFFYGIFGGILGIGLGIGILKLTIGQVFQMANMDQVDFQLIYMQNMLISLLMAIALVGISCLLPVLQIAKHSIRGLLFSEIKNTKHFSVLRSAIGLFMVISSFFLVNTSVKELRMPFSFLGIMGVTVGGALLIPTLTMIVSVAVRGLMGVLLGQHGRAATTQIAHDKTLMNNVILMSMGLAVILMINNFSASVADLVKNAYDKGNADIMMMYYPYTQDFADEVAKIEGVTHVYSTKHLLNVEANQGEI